jgi:capsular polysaccharide transport system permease protein
MPVRISGLRYLHAPGNWWASFLLVLSENWGGRYKRTRWQMALAVFEPLAVIGALSSVHELISNVPAYGTSNILFFATGVIPFYLFLHISWRIRLFDRFQRLPRTTTFEYVLAHLVSEFLIKSVILVICFTGLWLLAIPDAFPAHPAECLGALAVVSLLGLGVGFLTAAISGVFPAWVYIYPVLIRGWMAFSGVLLVVDYMPPRFREVAVYNPLLHAITWYRMGHYPYYPHLVFDFDYMLICTGVILCIGWLSLIVTRKWRQIL